MSAEKQMTRSEALAAQIEAEDAEDANNPNTPKDIVSPEDWASAGVVPTEVDGKPYEKVVTE